MVLRYANARLLRGYRDETGPPHQSWNLSWPNSSACSEPENTGQLLELVGWRSREEDPGGGVYIRDVVIQNGESSATVPQAPRSLAPTSDLAAICIPNSQALSYNSIPPSVLALIRLCTIGIGQVRPRYRLIPPPSGTPRTLAHHLGAP
jgi:hypothetical protein